MRIIECYVENFGKLSGYTQSFSEGLNATLAENGAGKTTLSVFIKAMFYGLNTERRQSLDENDRKKYAPWQGGRWGGSLTFTEGGKTYRIERTFSQRAGDDIFRVVDVGTGIAASDYTENIGFELFGIDAAGFERTVFLSEKNLTGAISNDTISAKLSNLVGTTGDVGAVGDAVSKLEERRKYYQKRGNTGEIAVIRQRISECDAAVDALRRKMAELDAKEARLAELEAEIKRSDDRCAVLRDELAAHRAAAVGRTHREQYMKMREEVARERREYEELSAFFASGVPEQAEIDEARDAARDAAALRASKNEYGNSELSALSEFFRSPTGFAEIESVKAAERQRLAKASEAEAVRLGAQFAEAALTEELGGKIPDPEDIRRAANGARNRSGAAVAVILAVLSVIALLPALLVNILFMAAAVPLAVASVVIGTLSFVKNLRALKYAESIGIYGKSAEEIEALAERIVSHAETVRRDRERIEALTSEACEAERVVSEFIARYPHGEKSEALAIAAIEEKYVRYYSLADAARRQDALTANIDARLHRLDEVVRAFSEKYPTSSDMPFDDVRERLNTYTYLKRTLVKREDDLREFATLHGIREGEAVSAAADTATEQSVERELNECKARVMALRREHALSESEYNTAVAEVERIDEIRAVRADLNEKHERYLENLAVIIETQKTLTAASEAMTSRYIGGTKASFLRYTELIGDEASEFSMGADFLPKIYDKGETRVMESYSKGTRDMRAFCLRIALADALWGGNAPLIMLDDPFTSLDGEKLERAKSLVRSLSREKQIIYFTCSKERMI